MIKPRTSTQAAGQAHALPPEAPPLPVPFCIVHGCARCEKQGVRLGQSFPPLCFLLWEVDLACRVVFFCGRFYISSWNSTFEKRVKLKTPCGGEDRQVAREGGDRWRIKGRRKWTFMRERELFSWLERRFETRHMRRRGLWETVWTVRHLWFQWSTTGPYRLWFHSRMKMLNLLVMLYRAGRESIFSNRCAIWSKNTYKTL